MTTFKATYQVFEDEYRRVQQKLSMLGFLWRACFQQTYHHLSEGGWICLERAGNEQRVIHIPKAVGAGDVGGETYGEPNLVGEPEAARQLQLAVEESVLSYDVSCTKQEGVYLGHQLTIQLHVIGQMGVDALYFIQVEDRFEGDRGAGAVMVESLLFESFCQRLFGNVRRREHLPYYQRRLQRPTTPAAV